MNLYYDEVKSFEIKRRTFEGKTDPSKNSNSLTSKYMPSYKYWLKINYPKRSTETCFPTKKECLAKVDRMKKLAGKPL